MTTRCYGIDGKAYADMGRYIPCNTTAAASGLNTACCAPGDNCLTNGFCQSQADASRNANLFWRNGCTDPTWDDPACPKFCNGLNDPATHGIYYCLKPNSYCCPTWQIGGEAVNTTCCSSSSLTFSAAEPSVYTIAKLSQLVATATDSQVLPTTISRAQSSGVSTTASSSRATQTSSDSSSSTSTTSSGDNKMGVYVGVPLGILLAIALAVIAWLLVKNKKLKQANTRHELPNTEAYAHQHQDKPQTGYAPHEMRARPNELYGQEVAQELPNDRWRQ